jgi:mRNA-degrading endonuclease toxin of MazEF toxin-antitoxin module
MKRGEIYRTQQKTPERGHKPGFYVVVSRNFVAQNEDISTVVCAPVYSKILGLRSEVVIGVEEGLTRESAIRCDFLTLMFKSKLTRSAGALSVKKISELNRALRYALEDDAP